MNSIEQIKENLKKILSSRRFEHSIGVMEKALELAKQFGEDEEKVKYCALIHDIAKEMSHEELLKYCEENNIHLSEIDKLVPSVLHGIVGADIAKREYDFTKEMQDAIYYHTTGRENMTLIEKIIYVSDKSEERTRIGEEVNKLRNIIKDEGLDKAILFIINDWTIPKAIKENKIIHTNTIEARNYIIENIKK